MSQTADRREILYVVRAKPIGLPVVETARLERVGPDIATMSMPGGSRLLVPLEDDGSFRAGGQVRGVYREASVREAYALARGELTELRTRIERELALLAIDEAALEI